MSSQATTIDLGKCIELLERIMTKVAPAVAEDCLSMRPACVVVDDVADVATLSDALTLIEALAERSTGRPVGIALVCAGGSPALPPDRRRRS